jgi:hypothetical protein
MRTLTIPGTRSMIIAVALASLSAFAHAELNLNIPKAPQEAAGNTQANNANRLNLGQDPDAPQGYQTSDRCAEGTQLNNIHTVNGKRYYKCERTGPSMPPTVRDAERYQRSPTNCYPGSMEAQCRNVPR